VFVKIFLKNPKYDPITLEIYEQLEMNKLYYSISIYLIKKLFTDMGNFLGIETLSYYNKFFCKKIRMKPKFS
jgi:hypothetical protein